MRFFISRRDFFGFLLLASSGPGHSWRNLAVAGSSIYLTAAVYSPVGTRLAKRDWRCISKFDRGFQMRFMRLLTLVVLGAAQTTIRTLSAAEPSTLSST